MPSGRITKGVMVVDHEKFVLSPTCPSAGRDAFLQSHGNIHLWKAKNYSVPFHRQFFSDGSKGLPLLEVENGEDAKECDAVGSAPVFSLALVDAGGVSADVI